MWTLNVKTPRLLNGYSYVIMEHEIRKISSSIILPKTLEIQIKFMQLQH